MDLRLRGAAFHRIGKEMMTRKIMIMVMIMMMMMMTMTFVGEGRGEEGLFFTGLADKL